ncbi:MAG: NADAR family protein [Sandaracinaceae bacterium]
MDIDTLRTWVRDGHSLDYLLFWGHRQKRVGAPDASCLSQWFPARFVVEGITYPTAEHWMMAGKARLVRDDAMLDAILRAGEPGEAKALGRRVAGYDDAAWAAARSALVVDGNVAKFSQNPTLEAFLLNTGRRVLVEASPRDRIWGIGMGASNPDAKDPMKWRGTNLLGFALMETRVRLGGALGGPD